MDNWRKMEGYIRRQDAIDICFSGKVANNYDIAEEIEKLQTADVVPMVFHDRCMEIEITKRMNMVDVVRCKDCKDYQTPYCPLCHVYKVEDNDFCSYGERKPNDN